MTTYRQAPPPGCAPDAVYVGVGRAAGVLGVSERTIERWADAGLLPVAWSTDGGHRRFDLAQLSTPTEDQ